VFDTKDKNPNNARKPSVTADNISKKLAGSPEFEGFVGTTLENILGDMMLAFCLENNKRALGRDKQIQRIAATHYMASWVDLPPDSADLRGVPEMIVAILANQKKGTSVSVSQDNENSRFKVGKQAHNENLLLKTFNAGIYKGEGPIGPQSDKFDEGMEVSLDQLLTIRLAMLLKHAPPSMQKSSKTNGPDISNQRPIAKTASEQFHDDMRKFIRDYSDLIPRQVFLEMLESCMAVGLTTIFTSVVNIMLDWEESGEILENQDQHPAAVFLDCSNGTDRILRAHAETSMEGVLRRARRLPVTLIAIRLLNSYAQRTKIKGYQESIETIPFADKHLNFLGDILHGRTGDDVKKRLEMDLNALVDQLETDGDDDDKDIIKTLRDENQENPVWRLAEALQLVRLRIKKSSEMMELLKSILMSDYPNGIARQRKTKDSPLSYSMVLTDSLIDYLVHLPDLGNKKGLGNSLNEFTKRLIESYGFYIDEAPPGTDIPADVLRKNRMILERRLRDLGLLMGVNDAESMKLLKLRFAPPEGEQYEID